MTSYAYNEERMLEGIRQWQKENAPAERLTSLPPAVPVEAMVSAQTIGPTIRKPPASASIDLERSRRSMLCRAAVLQVVALNFGYAPETIIAPYGTRKVLAARHIATALLRRRTDLSSPSIARLLGNRHHTTILHSVKVVEERCKDDADFKRLIEGLNQAVDARLGISKERAA